jgi:hypothetical protein
MVMMSYFRRALFEGWVAVGPLRVEGKQITGQPQEVEPGPLHFRGVREAPTPTWIQRVASRSQRVKLE